MTTALDTARTMLRHWGLENRSLVPVSEGLINLTLRVEDGERFFVLQRLNPIFRAEVHLDIDAVTTHLTARGLETPRLLRTHHHRLWATDPDGGVWRLQTGLPGTTETRVTDGGLAAEAGGLLGRFHHALHDCTHEFEFTRQAHGLAGHLETLRGALADHAEHPLYDAVTPPAETVLRLAAACPGTDELPRRIVHGDPKISNVLFHQGRALAWVDLDTLGRLDLPTELGDAFRSWCNPAGEDGDAQRFDPALFEAALAGYADAMGGLLTTPEREALVDGALRVCVELASRFLADALRERYFGWDDTRFPSRGAHNLHRGLGQLRLAQSLAAQRAAAEAVVARVFG